MTEAGGEPAAVPEAGLRKRTAIAAIWSAVGTTATQLLTVVFSIILARLLAPGDFGAMGLATTVVGITGLICEAGFVTSLVQRRDVSPALWGTVSWVQIGLGLAGTGILLAVAGATAGFFHDARLHAVVSALSVVPLLSALGAVPRAMIVRDLNFRRLAATDLVALLVGGAVGVVIAVGFHSIWALAVYSILQSLGQTAGRIVVTSWRPQWVFDWAELRDILPFARSVYLSQLLTYVTRNGDNVLVGKVLGVFELGLYTRSYTLLILPTRQIASVLGNAVQVALARISDDKQRSARVYLEACQLIFFLTTPLMLLLAILARETVLTLFGAKWEHMWPTATVFALVALVEPLSTTSGWVFLAQRRPELNLRFGLMSSPVLLGGVALGLFGGKSSWVAVGYAIGSIALTPLFLRSALGLLELRLRDLARPLAPTFACGVVLTAVALPAKLLLNVEGAPPEVTLVLCGLLGTAAYLLMAHRLQIPVMDQLRARALGLLRRGAAA